MRLMKPSSVLLAAALSMSLAAIAPVARSASDTPSVSGAPLALVAAAAKIHDGKIDVNGVRYYYLLAMGHGTPIVLLHGWGSTSFMWRFVMRQLVARGYTVLAPDLRGLGDTAKPAAGYEKVNIAEVPAAGAPGSRRTVPCSAAHQ